MAVTDSDITDAALSPKSVQTAAGSVVNRDVSEVIAAQKHTDQQTAGDRAHLGLRFVQLVNVRSS